MRSKKPAGAKSISAKAKKKMDSRRFGILFGGLFVAVGLAVTVLWTVPLMTRALESRSWPAIDCRVISSRVGHHDSDDGTTYSIDIVYAYSFDGQEFRSDRYSFLGGSSSGYEAKKRVVENYPAGAQRVCYVDPSDPTVAVLQRGFRMSYLFSLLPLLFVIAGLLVCFRVGKNKSGRLERKRSEASASWGLHDHGVAETIELKPAMGPFGQAMIMLGVAIFWNGIVSIFVMQVVEGFRSDRVDWFMTLFMIPFVLVGIGLVIAFIFNLLKLANPRVKISMTPGEPQIGDPVCIEWQIAGSANRIKKLTFQLDGIEEAHYRVGTSNRVDRNTFHTQDLATASSHPEIRNGRAEWLLPGETVPSLDLSNNKIVWKLTVKGEIPNWPDLSNEYTLHVRPLGEKV